jgi:hypothetical protein
LSSVLCFYRVSRSTLHAFVSCLSQVPTQSINEAVGALYGDDCEDILNELFPQNDQLTMAHFIEVYKILDGILNDTSVDE